MGVDFKEAKGGKCTVLYQEIFPASMMLCVGGLIEMVECVVNVRKDLALWSIPTILTA